MKSPYISFLSKVLCLIGVAALIVSLFVPLWRIELDAPQYPEGLNLLIYPHKLGGNVDIINGLNHYIGMATLHTENFVEFTVLPYIIGFFALSLLVVAIVGKRNLLNIAFALFVIFGILAMVDFWRWEYNYGHNLDPNAAIIVPGMAYQPPLIGFKQLLNFGAYSIPDIGGWMFILCGILLLIAVLKEANVFQRFSKRKSKLAGMGMAVIFGLSSCSISGPEPIRLHKDNCEFCKMTIADGRFGAEYISEKGRIYKFDDISCLIEYASANSEQKYHSLWVANYNKPTEFVNIEKAFFVYSEKIKSPMRGDIASFATLAEAQEKAAFYETTVANWEKIKQ